MLVFNNFLKLITKLLITKNFNNLKNSKACKAILFNDYISKEIIINGIYEKNECECILKKLINKSDKKKNFIDIGANLGNHSIFFSEFFNKIYAFEPNKVIYSLLNFNTKEYKNIKTFNLGLSNNNTIKKIYYNNENYGGGSVFKENKSLFKNKKIFTQNIKLKKLDNIKLGREKVAIVKIDVEGHEYEVLRGMQKILASDSPILLIEIDNIYNKNLTRKIFNYLKKNNYLFYYEMVKKTYWPLNLILTNLKIKYIQNFKNKYYSLVICSKYKINL